MSQLDAEDFGRQIKEAIRRVADASGAMKPIVSPIYIKQITGSKIFATGDDESYHEKLPKPRQAKAD